MAEELRTVLGFEAKAAIATLGSMETALKEWSNAMAAAAAATALFNRAASGLDAKLKTAAASSGVAASANVKVADSAKKVAGAVKPIGPAVEKAAEKTKKASSDMILSWKSVIRIFAIQVIHQMISKVTSAMGEGSRAAREYEKALAEVQTIGAEFRGNLEELAKQAEEFSRVTGQPLPAVTRGLYQTLSNQVVEAGESFEFLKTASDFAIAAVTDLDSSVNLLSSAINSYGMSADEARDAAGKLFKTIELGRVRGEEFADTYGRVLVLSAQLGVSFDEVNAAMATLTVSGLKYNEAFTLITNVQLKLIKPTDALKARFDELGIATSEAGIQAYGFQGLLDKITEGSGKSATALGEMFGRVRAIRGALGLTSEHGEHYVKVLKEIREASAETLEEAKEIIFETNAKQVELEFNKVDVTLTRLGRTATSVSLTIMDAFGGAVATLTTLTLALGAGIGVWIAFKVGAIAAISSIGLYIADLVVKLGVLQAAVVSAKVAMVALFTTPIGLAIVAATAIIGGAIAYNYMSKAAERADKAIILSSERRIKDQQRLLDRELKAQKITRDKQLGIMQEFLFERAKAYRDAAAIAGDLETRQFDSIKSQLSDHIGAIHSFFDAVIAKSEEAAQKIKEINNTILGLKAQMSDWNFERSLKGIGPLHQAYAKIERSETLRRAAIEALRKGDIEAAKALNERATAQAKSAVAAADQSKNATLIRKAEEEVNLAMQNQITVQQQLKKNTIDQKEEADKNLASIRAQGTELDALAKKYADLKIKAGDVKLDPIDRAKIEADLTTVAKNIEVIFADVGEYVDLAEILDIKPKFAKATEGFFDPITGQLTTFEEVTKAAINRCAAAFSNFAKGAEGDMQKVIDAMVGVGPPEEQQARIAELRKQLDRAAQATRDSKKAQEELNTEIARAPGLEKQLLAELEKTHTSLRRGIIARKGLVGGAEELQKLDALAAEASIKLLSDTSKARALLAEGKGDTQEFANVMTKLTTTLANLMAMQAEKGIFERWITGDEVTILEKIIDSLNKTTDAQIAIGAAADQVKLGEKAREQLNVYEEAINKWKEAAKTAGAEAGDALGSNISDSAAVGTSGVEGAASAQVAALKRVEAQALVTAAAIAKAGSGGGGEGKAKGGLIYRNSGGFTPRGTDTIPAMLSPGEFVVNAASTRKFFSQLVAINSGVKPVYREIGGAVTTIGDVKINITESTSPKQTARETMSAFRRETRRMSSTL